jgi:hypothetical protein
LAPVPNVVSSPAPAISALTAIGLVGFHLRPFGEYDAKRVQQRVVALDPLQIQVHELAGGDLARGDQLGLAGDGGEGEVQGVHRGRILCAQKMVRLRRAARRHERRPRV